MSPKPPISPYRAVATLGTTQTIGFACSFYLPAALAKPMAAGVGAEISFVFLAFSAAMLLQPVVGPYVGRLVDQRGGRGPLSVASVLLAAGLVALGASQTPWQLALAWLVIGLGMAGGLYDIVLVAGVAYAVSALGKGMVARLRRRNPESRIQNPE